jgi:2-polyprenyl-6-hydroxyphenyl methylase/3-demethylubiquinone-9 3-methyltransferase
MSHPEKSAEDIDWGWTKEAVVPAYYERALAPLRSLPFPGDRILEVGVGCGYVLSRLTAACGGHGVGTDNDPQAISLARSVAERFAVHLDMVLADGQRLPFPDASFDLVYSQGLIEHFSLDRAEGLVSEHVRVVRPGGFLALSVPNLLNPFHTWLKWREGKAYRFHPERSYTPRRLARLLDRHGIRVRGVDGYGLFWSLWHQRSRLAYYTTAATLRLGLGQEFETLLSAWLRSRLCMMTLAWGERAPR